MTSSGLSSHNTYTNMVTQLYTFSSWSKSKSFSYCSDGLPYVGFPGLTLTPIPENPLLDSMVSEGGTETSDPDKRLQRDDRADPKWTLGKGSLPNHWATTPTHLLAHDVEAGKGCSTPSSKTSSIDMSSKQCFLPKDDDERSTTNPDRSHVTKLLLFALCGIVIVAAIVLWIFSPAFA